MNPRLLPNLLGYTLAALLLAVPVHGVLTGWLAPDEFPLRWIRVEGEFRHVSAEHVRAALSDELNRGFFALDLTRVAEAAREVPWVAEVEARKHWPDTLEVRVQEYVAVARWSRDELVDANGRIFTVAGAGEMAGLPALRGPRTRAAEILAFHGHAQRLLAGTGLAPTRVQLSNRGGWMLTLADGARLMLGREDAARRLERFARAYPKLLSAERSAIEYADMRYTNGFAVRWKPQPQPEAVPAVPAGEPDVAPVPTEDSQA